jgi:molybdopterin-guanine dinucleotide biosynthesis protein A
VVLAGGRSSRFGSDKLEATVGGVPILRRAIDAVALVADDVIVVLAPDGERDLPPGVRVVRDTERHQGPLAGAARGLEGVTTEWALLAAGDMPALHPAVLREIIGVAHDAPVDAVALADGDRFRPLPSATRSAPARANAEALLGRGERRLRALLESLRTAVIDEATWTELDPGRGTLLDVDTPADLDDGVGSG